MFGHSLPADTFSYTLEASLHIQVSEGNRAGRLTSECVWDSSSLSSEDNSTVDVQFLLEQLEVHRCAFLILWPSLLNGLIKCQCSILSSWLAEIVLGFSSEIGRKSTM